MIYNEACTRCSLYRSCRTVCLPADTDAAGKGGVDLLFVGEAPGRTEDEQGKPFIGDSGQILRAALSDYGFSALSYVITNAVKCRPWNNAEPSKDNIEACKLYLEAEIKGYNPKLIVALGSVAARALLNESTFSVLQYTSAVLRRPDGHLVLVNFHPAALLHANRGEAVDSNYRKVLRRWRMTLLSAKQLITNGMQKPTIECVESLPRMFTLLNEVKNYGPVAFDYETTDVYPWKGRIRTVGISLGPGRGASFRLETIKGGNSLWKRFLAGSVPKIAHNYTFEYLWSRHHFHESPRNVVGDTMALFYAESPDDPIGLKLLSRLYTPFGGYEIDMTSYQREVGDPMKAFTDAPFNLLAPYNGADAVVTKHLWDFAKQEVSDRAWRLHDSLLFPAIPAFANMTERGVLVDAKAKESAEKWLELQIKDVSLEIEADPEVRRWVAKRRAFSSSWDSTRTFNPASPKQVQSLLSEYLEQAGTKVLTRKGKYSASKEALAKLETSVPIAKKIAHFRSLKTIQTHFLNKMGGFISFDGKIHPGYNLFLTATGRTSSDKPNLQNIPDIPEIRNIYTASKGVLISADFSRIELVVAAYLSGEESILEDMRQGRDSHRMTAERLFGLIRGLKPSDITKELRDQGKTMNFLSLYGGGIGRIVQVFNCTKKEAQQLLEGFWHVYPNLKGFMDETKKLVSRDGFVLSPSGRIRKFIHLKGASESDGYDAGWKEACNFRIQSSASDLGLWSVYEVDRLAHLLGLGGHLMGFIHDQLVADGTSSDALSWVGLLHHVMTERVKGFHSWLGDCPIDAEVEIGPSLGSLTPVASDEVRRASSVMKERINAHTTGCPDTPKSTISN